MTGFDAQITFVYATDLAKSAAFYGDVLGLELPAGADVDRLERIACDRVGRGQDECVGLRQVGGDHSTQPRPELRERILCHFPLDQTICFIFSAEPGRLILIHGQGRYPPSGESRPVLQARHDGVACHPPSLPTLRESGIRLMVSNERALRTVRAALRA